MSLVTLSDISKRFGAEEVLRGVSFRVERGDHLALVGSNGAGKSTILRMIAGLDEPNAGTLSRTRNLTIAYLPQDPDFGGAETLYEATLDVFRPVIEAQERLRVLEQQLAARHDPGLMEEYGELQTRIEHAGYDYRDRIERVLLGLELERDLWHEPIDNLSGGQRTRANLARTLLEDADLLLLDEPTNHLDIPAVEWLESYLRDLKRTFVIVAHDRYMLDRVTNRTVEVSFGRTEQYDAPYSRFLQLKAERTERQREEYDEQQRHIARTEDFIRRYGAGQRSKEARGRQKQLDRLERIERPQDSETVHLRLEPAKRSGELVLEARHLVVGYPDNPLVTLPEAVVVRRAERVAVVGPNGSGKTTLLRTLVGELPQLEGSIRWGSNTTLGYYSQSLESLDESRTVLEEIQAARPLGEEEGRGYLGRFLFSGDDVFKTVSVLSGGERSRVALARLILEAPNVLVLDEPTNHLDIASRDALQAVLSSFGGTVLFVSHDRYLIDALAQQLWVVGAGRMTRYAGGYSSYASGAAVPLDRDEPAASPESQASPRQRLDDLQAEVESVLARLGDVGSVGSLAHLTELMERYETVQRSLERAQTQWLDDIRQSLRSSSV
jgi:ATP-binding cassette subfamily F protein 3